MFAYVIRRIIWSIPVILLLAFAIFALMRVIPGGPFDFVGDRSLPQSVRDNLERRHHLDWSLGWQFSSYVLGDDATGAICQGLSFVPGCEQVQETAGLGISHGLIRGDLEWPCGCEVVPLMIWSKSPSLFPSNWASLL